VASSSQEPQRYDGLRSFVLKLSEFLTTIGLTNFPWLNDVLILQQKHVEFQQVTKIVPAHVVHCSSIANLFSAMYMLVLNLLVDIAKSGATDPKS